MSDSRSSDERTPTTRPGTLRQIEVLSNQCTGTPIYRGDPDADPANNSDCTSGSSQDEVVRAAELQVFGE